jgi:hypothetical protein
MALDLELDYETKKIKNNFIKGKQLIMQRVVLALQCWTGDWFLDGEYGIPYDLRIDNKGLLLADAQSIILGVEGVSSVKDLDLKVTYGDMQHKSQRIFHITGTVETIDNEIGILNDLIPVVGE